MHYDTLDNNNTIRYILDVFQTSEVPALDVPATRPSLQPSTSSPHAQCQGTQQTTPA
jgi:hypothetical protein